MSWQVQGVLLTEGDLDRGSLPAFDAAEYGWLHRAGSKELPPDACLSGHVKPRFIWGWEPGRGRTFACTVPDCGSVQYRR